WHRVDNGGPDRKSARRAPGTGQRTRLRELLYHSVAGAGGRDVKKILIVEDEPSIALALEDDLRREGYDTEVASDGDTAARRAMSREFDLILLDVMLPKQDGFEVCRQARLAGVDTPILMLTAKTQEAEKVLGLE